MKEETREYLKSYGKMMRLLRKRRNLSQKEVAESVGVSQSIISHIEQGYYLPPGGVEEKLFAVLRGDKYENSL